MKIARFAVVSTAALALMVGSFGMAGAESKKGSEQAVADEVPAVVITGGTMTNTTTLDIAANGGTAIGDASGGSNNVAVTNGGSSDGVVDIASAGNGGGATAAANGGAVSVGDVNSGGNAGNAIIVGDTNSGVVEAPKPDEGKKAPDYGKPDYGKPDSGKKGGDNGGGGGGNAGGGGGGRVRALPATGVGGFDAGLLAPIAAAGAAAAAGLGLRRR